MSFNGYGKMNSDDVGIYLQLKTDAIITAVPLLYIAPPPSRHDTQQIPVVRSLGLYRRSNNQAPATLSLNGGALLPCSGSSRLSYRR